SKVGLLCEGVREQSGYAIAALHFAAFWGIGIVRWAWRAPSAACMLLESGATALSDAAWISSGTGRRYLRNCSGFSLIGKWPTSCIAVTFAPGMDSAVRTVSSGEQEKSYSPVSR